jgi:hypothetical protein
MLSVRHYTSPMPQPWQVRCVECERLAREFQDAWRSDQQQVRGDFHGTAEASGRDPEKFLRRWVNSVAQMPDDEFESLQWAHYPRVAEVGRRWQEHATRAGHRGGGTGRWRRALIFHLVLRSGYAGFLTVG